MDLDFKPVKWRVRRKSRLELMADRAAVLADLPIGELRRVSGYDLKSLRGLSRGQLIAEILEDEFLV
jgi:hypothetical protein